MRLEDISLDKAWVLEGYNLRLVASVMNTLYAERTLNGDAQRDLAHKLHLAITRTMEVEHKED